MQLIYFQCILIDEKNNEEKKINASLFFVVNSVGCNRRSLNIICT